MNDFLLLNGGQKATLIERFDNTAVLIAAGKKQEFLNLSEAKTFVKEKELEINVAFLFGSSVKRASEK